MRRLTLRRMFEFYFAPIRWLIALYSTLPISIPIERSHFWLLNLVSICLLRQKGFTLSVTFASVC